MTGFQILCLVLSGFFSFILIVNMIFTHFAKKQPMYSTEMRKIDERFETLKQSLSEEDKLESIKIMKQEIQELFNEFGSNCRLVIRSDCSGLSKGNLRYYFRNQDMFDYAQGYFKCYQVVRFKDDDYVDYIFPMDQNIHLKMV